MRKYFLSILLSALTLTVAEAAKIKIHVKYVEGDISSNLEGAEVKCWDEDSPDTDDLMTSTKKTNSNGHAELYYEKKKKSTWLRPTRGWDVLGKNSNPDIYCRVTKDGVIVPLHTKTKSNQDQEVTANLGTVYAYPDRAGRGDKGNTNGCGAYFFPQFARDAWDEVSGMKMACDNHDLCYHSCKETQVSCDKEFKAIMYSICEDKNDNTATKKSCEALADGMYAIVQEFGVDSFEASAKENCGEERS